MNKEEARYPPHRQMSKPLCIRFANPLLYICQCLAKRGGFCQTLANRRKAAKVGGDEGDMNMSRSGRVGILLACILCGCVGCIGPMFPKARVTVRVVGEDGLPVPDATVHIGFAQGGNAWIGKQKGKVFHGLSDTNGCYSATAQSELSVGGGVEKAGYYRSSWNYTFRNPHPKMNRWEPWNPTNTVVLRRIGHPIPMYAKRVEMNLPDFNQALGFDLEKGDWVAPWGQGLVSDFVFHAERTIIDKGDYEAILRIDVSHAGDGFQAAVPVSPPGSIFLLPPEAPFGGYQTNIILRWGRRSSGGGQYWENSTLSGSNYFFRVRTALDEQGNVQSALYGKTHGVFSLTRFLRDRAKVSFMYYLNPTPNDRNVEFDPAQNLFEDFKPGERVVVP